MWDAADTEAPQVTVCSSEAGLLIWIKAQLVLERPALIARGGRQGTDMQIISRAEAIKQGLKRYFTGKPCKCGHVAERQVLNATCVDCQRAANKKSRLKKSAARRR